MKVVISKIDWRILLKVFLVSSWEETWTVMSDRLLINLKHLHMQKRINKLSNKNLYNHKILEIVVWQA